MTDEQLVSDVLSAIAWINRAVARKVLELQNDRRLSGLTFAVEVGKTFELDYPPASALRAGTYETEVTVDAYVDGSIERAHGVPWTLRLLRRGEGWGVDRGVTLHADDERHDVVEELPPGTFEDSAELVAALPALVDEWLAMEIPPIPLRDSGGR
jgi:hypothetical protein